MATNQALTDHCNFEVVQILKSSGKGTYDLNEEALRTILTANKVGKSLVAIYSIAGAFRTGKSLALNLLSSFLKHGRSTNWMQNKAEEISQTFEWRGGTEGCTDGIWISNKPIYLPDAHGKEVAVFLVDTQGAFDNKGGAKANATIFAMSMLMSSVQILNIKGNLQENDLQFLRLFTEYAKLARSHSAVKGETFQKLLFLIRDFSSRNLKGFDGGKTVLENFLKNENEIEDLAETRESLKRSFETLQCFTASYPGVKVAENDDEIPLLKIQDIADRFISEMHELSFNLFVESIIPKKVNGKAVVGNELFQFVVAYWNIFKSGKMPDVKTIFETTAMVELNCFHDELLQKYVEEMDKHCATGYKVEENLLKLHHKTKESKLTELVNTPKLGNKDLLENHRKKLNSDMEQKFELYKRENFIKKRELDAALGQVIEEAAAQYSQSLQEILAGDLYSTSIPLADKESKAKATNYFRENANKCDPQMLSLYQKKLQERFQLAFAKFENTLQQEKDELRRKLSEKSDDALQAYKEAMEMGCEKHLDKNKFDALHKESMRKALLIFRKIIVRNIDETKQMAESTLNERIENENASFHKSNKMNKELFEAETNGAMHNVKDFYLTTMQEALGKSWNSHTRIVEAHKEAKKQSIAVIHSLKDSCKGDYSKWYEMYDDCISSALEKFKSNNDDTLKTFTDKLYTKADDALKKYQAEMEKVKEVYVAEKEFNDRHISNKRMALAMFGSLKDFVDMSTTRQGDNADQTNILPNNTTPPKTPPDTEENAKENDTTDTDKEMESEDDNTSEDDSFSDNFDYAAGPGATYRKIKMDLQRKIKKEFQKVLKRNKRNQKKAEKEADELITSLLKGYKEQLEEHCATGYKVEEDLLKLHHKTKESKLMELVNTPKLENKDLLESHRKKLDSDMEQKFELYKRENIIKKRELEAALGQVVEEAAAQYSQSLQEILTGDLNSTSIPLADETSKAEATNLFRKKANKCDPQMLSLYEKKLLESFQLAFAKFENTLQQEKDELQRKLLEKSDDALQAYKEEMEMGCEKHLDKNKFDALHKESKRKALLIFREINERNIDERKQTAESRLNTMIENENASFHKSNKTNKELFEAETNGAMLKVKDFYLTTMQEALGKSWNSRTRIDEAHKEAKKQSIAVIHSLKDSCKGDYSKWYEMYDECISSALEKFKSENDDTLNTFTDKLCTKADNALKKYQAEMEKVKEVYVAEKEFNDHHISNKRMALAMFGSLKDFVDVNTTTQGDNADPANILINITTPPKTPPDTKENAKENDTADTDKEMESEDDNTSEDDSFSDNFDYAAGPGATYLKIKLDLKRKIKKKFQKVLERNKTNKQKAEKEADELITSLINGYKENLKEVGDLEILHETGQVKFESPQTTEEPFLYEVVIEKPTDKMINRKYPFNFRQHRYVLETALQSMHDTLAKELNQLFQEKWPQLPNKRDDLENELQNQFEKEKELNKYNMDLSQKVGKWLLNFGAFRGSE